MRDILESEEVMTAYITIDLCYYQIQGIRKEMEKPSSTIERAIDEATGYGKVRNRECMINLIERFESIIENKKIIEADYSADQKTLDRISELLEEQL